MARYLGFIEAVEYADQVLITAVEKSKRSISSVCMIGCTQSECSR